MSRSYSFLVAITVILALCIAGGVVATKVVMQRRFQRAQQALNDSESAILLVGIRGDATVRVQSDPSPAEIDLIETCGPIRRLELGSGVSSPDAITRLLSLPGLHEIDAHRCPLLNEAIDGMCQHGRGFREINFVDNEISGAALSKLSTLPNLRTLDFDRCEVTDGVVSFSGGFPSLGKLEIEVQPEPPVVKIEVASLGQLEQLSVRHNKSDPATAVIPQVSITDLANLVSLMIVITPEHNNAQLSISRCPRLHRLALYVPDYDSRLLNEIAAAWPDLRELAIRAHGVLGPADATALARLAHLEALELDGLALRPSLLAAVGEMANLSRLQLADCHTIPEGTGYEEWVHADDSVPEVEAEADAHGVRSRKSSRWVGWAGVAKCSRLEELVFWSHFDTPDGLDWIRDLKSLHKLDLSHCAMNPATFWRWGPTSAPANLGYFEKLAMGREVYVDSVLQVCAEMKSLQELILCREQIDKIEPARKLEKLKISEGDRHLYSPFIWK